MEKGALKHQLVNFEIQLSDAKVESDNPMMTIATARILYEGNNRNGSHLTAESIIKALPTLKGTPVVGQYDKEKDNFKGHGGEVLIKEDGEVEFIDTTVPWGFVSENSNFFYEDVLDEDGETRTYLVADTVKLWTGRYPQLQTLLEEGKFNQSMEIEVQNGSYAVIDGQETFRIDEFIFSALCILGVSKDSDPYGHVEPCFEGASITINKDKNSIFSKRYSLMMEELKDSKQAEGGKSVELTHEQQLALFNAIKNKVAEEKDGAQPHENIYLSNDESHVFYLDIQNDKVMKAEFTVTEEVLSVDFESATESEANEATALALEGARLFVKAEKDFFETAKNLEEFDNNNTALKDQIKDFEAQVEKLTAEKVDVEAIKAQVEADFKEKHEATLNDALEQVGRLTGEVETKTGEFTALNTEFDSVKAELEELRAFRTATEAQTITEKFSGKLADDIIASTLEKCSGKSVEEIESALFVEIGKQNFSMEKDEKKGPKHTHVPGKEKEEDESYGGLFSKHQKD